MTIRNCKTWNDKWGVGEGSMPNLWRSHPGIITSFVQLFIVAALITALLIQRTMSFCYPQFPFQELISIFASYYHSLGSGKHHCACVKLHYKNNPYIRIISQVESALVNFDLVSTLAYSSFNLPNPLEKIALLEWKFYGNMM